MNMAFTPTSGVATTKTARLTLHAPPHRQKCRPLRKRRIRQPGHLKVCGRQLYRNQSGTRS
jgi:hypothetical protein